MLSFREGLFYHVVLNTPLSFLPRSYRTHSLLSPKYTFGTVQNTSPLTFVCMHITLSELSVTEHTDDSLFILVPHVPIGVCGL